MVPHEGSGGNDIPIRRTPLTLLHGHIINFQYEFGPWRSVSVPIKPIDENCLPVFKYALVMIQAHKNYGDMSYNTTNAVVSVINLHHHRRLCIICIDVLFCVGRLIWHISTLLTGIFLLVTVWEKWSKFEQAQVEQRWFSVSRNLFTTDYVGMMIWME